MNPKYSTTEHVYSEALSIGKINTTVSNLAGLTKRGEDLNNLIDVPSDFGYQDILSLINSVNVLDMISSKDDVFSRRPYKTIEEEKPTVIFNISSWAGNLQSMECDTDVLLVETLYNNLYATPIGETAAIRFGFIFENFIVFNKNYLDLSDEIQTEIMTNCTITIQRKIQTCYLNFEYPYLMNGTLNENVYEWSDPNKITSLMPITNIMMLDEKDGFVSLTSLSEPIKKTIAQDLRVRIRYDL